MGYVSTMLFATLTRSDFYACKERWGLTPYVQIHHIIPREFRNHPVMHEYDIHCGSNLMLMPNRAGKVQLHTHRIVHDGGHNTYNRDVGGELDRIYRQVPAEEHEEHIDQLIRSLRRRVRAGETRWE